MSASMAKVNLFRARGTGLRLAGKTMGDPERARDPVQIAEHWDLLADEIEFHAVAVNKANAPAPQGTQAASVRS